MAIETPAALAPTLAPGSGAPVPALEVLHAAAVTEAQVVAAAPRAQPPQTPAQVHASEHIMGGMPHSGSVAGGWTPYSGSVAGGVLSGSHHSVHECAAIGSRITDKLTELLTKL